MKKMYSKIFLKANQHISIISKGLLCEIEDWSNDGELMTI